MCLHDPYDICDQLCVLSKYDALECRAFESCIQACRLGKCGSMTCNAKECTQLCSASYCSTLTCPSPGKKCAQDSRRVLTYQADVCKQSCYERECQMICPTGGIKCTQVSVKSNAPMEWDRGLCTQSCSSGQCNMSCSSSVILGRCHQLCYGGKCDSIACNATNCTLVAYMRASLLQRGQQHVL